VHVGGTNGHPSTGGGWSSYYMEEHNMVAQAMQAALTSLVFERRIRALPETAGRHHGGRARLDSLAVGAHG
jgi:hypothetical protein